MQKKINIIAIISNGKLDANFFKKIIKDVDALICADGGANHAFDLSIRPDFVIGDMDSIRPEVREEYENDDSINFIADPNQDKTDAELALEIALELNPKRIIFMGCIGTRMDHTMANAMCLEKIPKEIESYLADSCNEIRLIRDDGSIRINGKEGDIVSVISLTPVEGLNYEGLKWEVKNKSANFGWFGISNRMLGESAKITLRKGRALIIKSRE